MTPGAGIIERRINRMSTGSLASFGLTGSLFAGYLKLIWQTTETYSPQTFSVMAAVVAQP